MGQSWQNSTTDGWMDRWADEQTDRVEFLGSSSRGQRSKREKEKKENHYIKQLIDIQTLTKKASTTNPWKILVSDIKASFELSNTNSSANVFKGDLRPKLYPYFHVIFLLILWKKEPCTKFCVVLVRLHKVITLQSFKFSVSDISPLFFFAFLKFF